MEEVKITKENYKGYVELYKHYMKMDFPSTEIFRKVFSVVIICTILSSLMFYFSPFYSFCFGIISNFAFTIGGIINSVINRIKTKQELKRKYPFINYDIKKKELIELLIKNNILQYNSNTKTYILQERNHIEQSQKTFEDCKVELDRITSFDIKKDNLLIEEETKQKVKTLGSR